MPYDRADDKDGISLGRKPIAGSRPSVKKSARKRLYQLHAWLGFHIAVLMTIVLASGTIATVSNEIDWLIQHDMRVTPVGEKVSWGEMEAAIRQYKPDGAITYITSMGGDYFAYRAWVTDPYGNREFVHVNQWTGEVTGSTHPITVQRFFRDFHRYLFLPGTIGLPLVTSLAFVLGVSLYTGLRTVRKLSTAMFRVRMDKGARILIGDAHKAIGVWSLWFLVIIIVTSVWYLIEFGVDNTIGPPAAGSYKPPALLSDERIAELGPVIHDRNLDDVVAAAEEAFPELDVSAVAYPVSLNGTFAVGGKAGNPFARVGSNVVSLDPETLEVLQLQKWKEFSAYYQVNEMADPLHFGYFGGLASKLVWFVFGAGLSGLSITGVWLTWRRLKSKTVSNAQFATMPVLVFSVFYFGEWLETYRGRPVPTAERALPAQSLPGDVAVRVYTALDHDGNPSGVIRMTLVSPNGRTTVRTATAEIAGEVVTGNVRSLNGLAPVRFVFDPARLEEPGKLTISFTFLNDTKTLREWDFNPNTVQPSMSH